MRTYSVATLALCMPLVSAGLALGNNEAGHEAGLVSVRVESLSDAEQQDLPISFGHVFVEGDVPAGMSLAADLADGRQIPLQVDAKATHGDGSLRHAVLTARLDSLSGGERVALLLRAVEPDSLGEAVSVDELLATDFEAVVNLRIDGVDYSVSARDLLLADSSRSWLGGPLAAEWLVDSPLVGPDGGLHPHLSVRFGIRAYEGIERVRVDIAVENTWSFVTGPQNWIYDVQVIIGGVEVYGLEDLEHYHHARWRKVFWWGEEPSVHVAHDSAYLIESGAVPGYDLGIVVDESALASMQSEWDGEDRGPMTVGFPVSYMPMTGGRRDIGPMPRWSVRYLLSMDKRAKEVSLGTATLAGTWSVHYRDRLTGLPVSLEDYPTMSLLSHGNPDQFPACNGCSNPNTHDSAHQPALAFLPYIVTGDYYYLEELQFWANFNMFESNPGYRGYEQGLLGWGQVRGQAWSLRTLGQAAYITPDDHPMKTYFIDRVGYNLDWYLQEYPENPSANVLGAIINGYAFSYNGGRSIATWQDDYFTWAAGYLADLGFESARALAKWKGTFPVGRVADPGYCWIFGAPYTLAIRDSSSGPVYTRFAQAYEATFDPTIRDLPCGGPEMAQRLGLQVGEMTGYSSSPQGYPSYMQPALAVAVQNCVPGAAEAWAVFTSRSVRPDYGLHGPEFAIVPRYSPADLNQDGLVDISDVQLFVESEPDLNSDGIFDLADVLRFVQAYLAGCSA